MKSCLPFKSAHHVSISIVPVVHEQAVKAGMVRPELWKGQGSRPGMASLIIDAADTLLAMPGYKDDLAALAPLVSSTHCTFLP